MQKRKPVTVTIFCFGVFFGIITTCMFLYLFKNQKHHGPWWDSGVEEYNGNFNLFIDDTGMDLRKTALDVDINQTMMYTYDQRGEEVAKALADKVRVLCWVMTTPDNHKTKAAAIRDTWGRRCNVLLFMSIAEDPSLPAVKLNVSEGRNHLFQKTKEAMKYVYKHYLEKVDWILKADDDTFTIIENLRYMLTKYSSQEPLYLGCRFKPFAKQGFMSGGAGYVLSRKALQVLVEQGIGEDGVCLNMVKIQENGEDVQLGRCLEMINVTAVDTRDEHGRGRFFPYGPSFHLFPDHSSVAFQWYWDYQYYPNPEGLNCCSDSAVSFHYISPNDLHVLHYLIYTLRPYGISLYNRIVNSTTIIQ